ncbi:vomeronasal type-1 receptor 4-like, partial [Panthera leo]|uniref:vomeronasal type-1 receptor 4-like n=1 Tax=Panthera leo TaxID=9689 RepID=UPI001C6A6B31
MEPTLFQIVVGVWGNFSLLYHSVTLAFSGCKPRSTDLILRHLTVANSLVLLSRGIPRTMAAFGLRHFLNYFGCKLVLYIHRVARGVTIGTICLLSVFQAITISPRKSRWAELKAKALKYIGSFNTLCWVLHMLVNFIFPVFATGRWSNKTITMMFCPSPLHDKVSDSTYTALIAFHDVLCLGLMSWASGSMVFILNRHRQRVQHIHRTKASPRSSPETRGIHTVLVLICRKVVKIIQRCLKCLLSSLLRNLPAPPKATLCREDSILGYRRSSDCPFVVATMMQVGWVRGPAKGSRSTSQKDVWLSTDSVARSLGVGGNKCCVNEALSTTLSEARVKHESFPSSYGS